MSSTFSTGLFRPANQSEPPLHSHFARHKQATLAAMDVVNRRLDVLEVISMRLCNATDFCGTSRSGRAVLVSSGDVRGKVDMLGGMQAAGGKWL